MKLSLYAQYVQERAGFEVIEDDTGFCTFYVKGTTCYLREFFIAPEARPYGGARHIFVYLQAAAMDHGAEEIVATVDLHAKNAQDVLKVCLRQGFKVVGAQNDILQLNRKV